MRSAKRSARASKWLPSAAALVVLALAPAAGAQQPRIVNGDDGEEVPWQVGLVDASFADAADGNFCGGTLVDPLHVVTAAHCVETRDGDEPDEVDVVAGDDDLNGPGIVREDVAAISSHPAYDQLGLTESDAAVLTLSAPLEGPGIAPLPLVAEGVDSVGEEAVISGWGATAEGGGQQRFLRHAVIDVLADSACDAYDEEGYVDAVMLCAGRTVGDDVVDTCQGDSGGPLALGPSIAAASDLIGIVSFGRGCARPGFPGVYTDAADPSVHGFLDGPHVARPHNERRPAVTGPLEAGQAVTCDPGTWSGAPATFTYRWQGVGGSSSSSTYTLAQADRGRTILCVVRAANGGGAVEAASSGVQVPIPPPPPPEDPPVDPPLPPPPPPPPPPVVDTTRPESRFTVRRCAARRCRLVLLVVDLGGVEGMRVRATVQRVGGGRRQTLRAVRRAAGRYAIRTPRLRPGRHRFTAVATDAAGNRQLRATVVTLRVARRA